MTGILQADQVMNSAGTGPFTASKGLLWNSPLAISSPYTILNNDGYSLFLCTAGGSGFNVTLPLAASNPGRIITFKKVDIGINNIGIEANVADTIEGGTSTAFGYGTFWPNSGEGDPTGVNGKGAYISLQSDGVNTWWYVAHRDYLQAYSSGNTSLTSNTTAHLQTISVPPGTWKPFASLNYNLTAITAANFAADFTAGTAFAGTAGISWTTNNFTGTNPFADQVLPFRAFTITSATNYILSVNVNFTGSTITVGGWTCGVERA